MEGIIPPSVRRLREMMDVLYDRKFASSAAKSSPELPVYYMHRAVARKEWQRYDITIIPPLMLGNEYNKTLGHYHSIAKRGLSYPEVYEVLHGSATYLLQRKEKPQGGLGKGGRIADVIEIEAKAGDKVDIPPNYGHVTINRSKPGTTLIMANIVSDHCVSTYDEYVKLHGAAYYYTKNSRDAIPNKNYEAGGKKLPALRKLPARSSLPRSLSLYQLLENNSRSLNFLEDPSLFAPPF